MLLSLAPTFNYFITQYTTANLFNWESSYYLFNGALPLLLLALLNLELYRYLPLAASYSAIITSPYTIFWTFSVNWVPYYTISHLLVLSFLLLNLTDLSLPSLIVFQGYTFTELLLEQLTLVTKTRYTTCDYLLIHKTELLKTSPTFFWNLSWETILPDNTTLTTKHTLLFSNTTSFGLIPWDNGGSSNYYFSENPYLPYLIPFTSFILIRYAYFSRN
jgi:hypothetical protein